MSVPIHTSNTKIVLQRFCSNFWGVLSSSFILLLSLLAFFAYCIAPDNSKNANSGDVSLRSQPPGFEVLYIELPSPRTPKFYEYFTGLEQPAHQIPISSYRITTDSLFYNAFSQTPQLSEEKSIPVEIFKNSVPVVKKKKYWLGTDSQGRDFLSRLLVGSRVSLSIGFVAVLISLFIGIPLGAIAGYFGGKTDGFILWIINIVWSIPTLLLVIAITLALGKGFWQVFIAVGLTMWVEVARIVRGQVISLKEQQYISATRALGYSHARIIIKHILPNCMAPVIVISAANFASAILMESGLSFLGLGAQIPVPSWGAMIKENYNYIILGKPYLALIPGIAMFLLVMSFMLIGNALRDVLDVKK